MTRDIRYGWRALQKTPAFALGAIVTVALAVSATTAIFSVVYGVLLRQLPYRDVERVFWIWSDRPGFDRTPFNVPDFIDYRDSTKTLSGLGGFFAFSANLSDESAAERVQGIRATGNVFDVIGARAQMGRVLQPSDERPGFDHVVILTEGFWLRRFGGDRSIIGRSIRLNSEEYQVIGVLASGFVMPVRDVEFVLPFSADQDPRRAARNSLNFVIGVGRLAENASATQATNELTGIARRLQEQFPVENARKRGVHLVSVIEGIAGTYRTALLTLFAAVAAVLLIACANLANLMLTRAASRRKELAVHLALGSSPSELIRKVLVEAMLIGLTGGALGVLFAHLGVVSLVALAPTALPRASEIRVDLVVLSFSLATSVVAAVLFGVVPALTSARVDVREALQGSGRGASAGGQRLRGLFVSSEVALASVLLIVMTMLGKSFANVQAVSPGFDTTRVLSARLTLPAKRFNTREAIGTFQRTLEQRLFALPTVTHMGAITMLPLSGLLARVPFTVEGRTIQREQVPVAQYRTVSPGYFEAAQIPLARGRTFSDADTGTGRAVAVVNQELARRWLDGLEPIGARLLVDDNDTGPRPIEIIGVVGNVQQMSLDREPTWDLYLTYAQTHPDNIGAAAGNMFWIVRSTSDPMSLASSLVREVRGIDPEVAASQVRPLEQYLSDAIAPRRFSLSLMAAFAVAALALAITGIYAVVSYSISQRWREIGIRAALGASRRSIVSLVVGQGFQFVLIGIAAGIAMAFGATRLLTSMLFGLASTDVVTFIEVAIAVGVVSVLACAVPTIRLGGLEQSVMRAE
jgi:putative ABC transport system permease protein